MIICFKSFGSIGTIKSFGTVDLALTAKITIKIIFRKF